MPDPLTIVTWLIGGLVAAVCLLALIAVIGNRRIPTDEL